MPPRGVKQGSKRARQYEHQEIAARTVNKEQARGGEANEDARGRGVHGRSRMTKAEAALGGRRARVQTPGVRGFSASLGTQYRGHDCCALQYPWCLPLVSSMFTESAFFTAAVKNGLYSAAARAARKEEERLARAIPVRPEEREPFPDADFRRDDFTNRALLDRMVPPD